jgi:RimJ/RimL family protein N-acetyltransferase
MQPTTIHSPGVSIRLEPFTDKDSDTLISWITNEEMLMQFAGPAFTYPLTVEQLNKNSAEPNRFVYKVIDKRTDLMIGYAEILLPHENAARLCRLIIGDTNQRGKGVGQQLVNLLLNIAFTEFQVTKVDLNVFDWNTGAMKCYEKCGFDINPEKTLTRHVNGQTWKGVNMEIQKDHWKEINNK